jgi:hypothetical protein
MAAGIRNRPHFQKHLAARRSTECENLPAFDIGYKPLFANDANESAGSKLADDRANRGAPAASAKLNVAIVAAASPAAISGA